MGSYAHLFTTNAMSSQDIEVDGVDQGFGYLLQKYHLPAFWTALFTEEDLKADKSGDDQDDSESQWILIAEKNKALQTLSSREAQLIRTLGTHVAPLIVQFAQYLEQSKGGYVIVQTDDLAGMLEDSQFFWPDELKYCIGVVAGLEPAPAFIAIPQERKGLLGWLFPRKTKSYRLGTALGYDSFPSWGHDVGGVRYVYRLAGDRVDDVSWQESALAAQ